MTMKRAHDIDEYIAWQSDEVKPRLQSMRTIIQKAAPKSHEVISYGMPAFKQGGVLVYFAVFKNHIGFFPTSSGVREFQGELVNYKTSKGTIQLPLDQPLPTQLIQRMVKFRVREVTAKTLLKKK